MTLDRSPMLNIRLHFTVDDAYVEPTYDGEDYWVSRKNGRLIQYVGMCTKEEIARLLSVSHYMEPLWNT